MIYSNTAYLCERDVLFNVGSRGLLWMTSLSLAFTTYNSRFINPGPLAAPLIGEISKLCRNLFPGGLPLLFAIMDVLIVVFEVLVLLLFSYLFF